MDRLLRKLADNLFLLHHGSIEEVSPDEEGITSLLARFREAPPSAAGHRKGRSPDVETGPQVVGGTK